MTSRHCTGRKVRVTLPRSQYSRRCQQVTMQFGDQLPSAWLSTEKWPERLVSKSTNLSGCQPQTAALPWVARAKLHALRCRRWLRDGTLRAVANLLSSRCWSALCTNVIKWRIFFIAGGRVQQSPTVDEQATALLSLPQDNCVSSRCNGSDSL